MKRTIFFSILLLSGLNLFSQSLKKENLRAGVGLFYATEVKNIALSINGVYQINEKWEGALSFTHIFEKDYVKWNILDFDGHYIFYNKDEKLNLYGLAGVSLTLWQVKIPAMDLGYGYSTPEVTSNGSDIGLNLGFGANINLSEKLNLAPEIRYTVIDGSYFRIGANLQYRF